MQRIYEVKEAHVFLIKSAPPKVAVTAAGLVPTTGWTRPELGAWLYITPPADGIQDFDFYAEEPTGIVLPVLTPIAAAIVIDRVPAHYWGKGQPLLGVRIHAASNSVEAKFDQKKTTEAHRLTISAARSGEVPWPSRSGVRLSGGDLPFPFKAGSRMHVDTPLGELLGKTLRVYRTGDVLTRDFRLDRANIELDPSTSRIVDVWFG